MLSGLTSYLWSSEVLTETSTNNDQSLEVEKKVDFNQFMKCAYNFDEITTISSIYIWGNTLPTLSSEPIIYGRQSWSHVLENAGDMNDYLHGFYDSICGKTAAESTCNPEFIRGYNDAKSDTYRKIIDLEKDVLEVTCPKCEHVFYKGKQSWDPEDPRNELPKIKSQPKSKTAVLRMFDPSTMKKCINVLAVGSRATGKTKLLKHLMDVLSLDDGLVVNPTNRYNKDYVQTDSLQVIEDYNPKILQDFIQDIKQNIKESRIVPNYPPTMDREQGVQERVSKTDDKLDKVLVLDDCLYDHKSWINDKNLKFLYMNGRCVKTNVLASVQYPFGFPPSMRTQIDYVFIFRETRYSNQKRLYDHYASLFPSFEMFSATLNACTRDYGCLVIDNTNCSDQIEDQVFWYKVPSNN